MILIVPSLPTFTRRLQLKAVTRLRLWTSKTQVRVLGFFNGIFLLFVLLLRIDIFYRHHRSIFVTRTRSSVNFWKIMLYEWVFYSPIIQAKGPKFTITNTLHSSNIHSQCLTTRIHSRSPNLWLHILFHYSGPTTSLTCLRRGLTTFIYFCGWRCGSTYPYLGTMGRLLFTTIGYAFDDCWDNQVGCVSPPTSLKYHNLTLFFIPKDSWSSPPYLRCHLWSPTHLQV